MSLDPIVQRRSRQPEQARGARSVSACQIEGSDDEDLFETVETLAKRAFHRGESIVKERGWRGRIDRDACRCRTSWSRALHRCLDIGSGNGVTTLRQIHNALRDVAQLANVAGPRCSSEHGGRGVATRPDRRASVDGLAPRASAWHRPRSPTSFPTLRSQHRECACQPPTSQKERTP